MVRKTTIPVATLKRLTDDAVPSVQRLEELGHQTSALSLRRSIARANEILASEGRHKHGELVAIESKHLSTLTADSRNRRASDNSAEFLRNDGYWQADY